MNNYEPGNKFGWKDFENAQEEYLAVRKKLLKRRIVPYLHQWNRVNDELNRLAGRKVYENLNPMLTASELVDLVLGSDTKCLGADEDIPTIADENRVTVEL